MKNRIGWCNLTFNPVWGCRNHCEYCYARGMARRFTDVIADKEHAYIYKQSQYRVWQDEVANRLRNFKPTFLKSHFDKKFPKKPQRIFVGSMSGIYYWKSEWVEMVIEKVKQYPQHTFMFLTQHPEVYERYNFPINCWLGVTMTTNKKIYYIRKSLSKVRFLSIEPLLEEIDIENIDDFEPDWIIVGAETGNRKGKIIPKKEWIEVIINFCNRTGVPLYLKDSLKNIYPEEIKEFPKGVNL